jgi:hypothetical protein
VAGATGQQGWAFIQRAIETTEDIRIIALSRKPQSPSAQSLRALSDRVKVTQANLDDAGSVRKVFEDASADGGRIWGVFMVLAFPGLGADAAGEQKQGTVREYTSPMMTLTLKRLGKTLVDLAHEYKVEHLIYSSAERGGESGDDQAKLDRLAKVSIELHIKSLSGLRWTCVRRLSAKFSRLMNNLIESSDLPSSWRTLMELLVRSRPLYCVVDWRRKQRYSLL